MDSGFPRECTLLAEADVLGMLHLHEEGNQVLKPIIFPVGYVTSSRRMKVGNVMLCTMEHAGREYGGNSPYFCQSQYEILVSH